jgi:hypothetical protein
MRRLLRTLLAALLGLLAGLGVPETSNAAPVPSAAVAAYAYDGQPGPAVSTTTTAERGPPAQRGHETAYETDDSLPSGVLARPDGATAPPTYEYNGTPRSAPTARGSQTAEGRDGDSAAGPSVVQRLCVAANAGDDVFQPPSATEPRTLDDALGPSSSITSSIRSQLRVVRTS